MILRPYRELSTEERFAALAAWVLLIWGAGHLIVIDLLPLAFGVYLYEVDPEVLQFMRDANFRFSILGQRDLLSMFYGLSFWFGSSLLSLGAITLLLANSEQVGPVVRGRIYIIAIMATAAFSTIAAVCFFALPVLGGALATVLFLLALRASRRQRYLPEANEVDSPVRGSKF